MDGSRVRVYGQDTPALCAQYSHDLKVHHRPPQASLSDGFLGGHWTLVAGSSRIASKKDQGFYSAVESEEGNTIPLPERPLL